MLLSNSFQTTIPVVCCMVLIIFTVLICAKYSKDKEYPKCLHFHFTSYIFTKVG